jgi:hypothetical protein
VTWENKLVLSTKSIPMLNARKHVHDMPLGGKFTLGIHVSNRKGKTCKASDR